MAGTLTYDRICIGLSSMTCGIFLLIFICTMCGSRLPFLFLLSSLIMIYASLNVVDSILMNYLTFDSMPTKYDTIEETTFCIS